MSMPLDTPAPAPALLRSTRPFYWSVRRELWESRSIYLAPAVVAAIILVGFLIAMTHSAGTVYFSSRANMMGQAQSPVVHQNMQAMMAGIPYHIMAATLIFTSIVVAVFYCLGSLFNERRDRSILFWKSLPVSNLTSVLAKAAVPMLVMPAVVFVTVTVAQLAMLILNVLGLALHGQDTGPLWSALPFGQGSVVLAYAVVAVALWYAPVYAWLMLVSAWSKNMTFLWAVAPPLVLSLFERVAFGTSYVGELVKYRLTGVKEAFKNGMDNGRVDLSNLDPVGYAATPGLWLGLIAAAVMLTAVVWLRRRREPI